MIERDIKWNAFVETDMLTNNGLIVNQYSEIKKIMQHPDEYREVVSGYLYAVLNNAVMNSDFYKEYDGFKSLGDFPVAYSAPTGN